MVKAIQKNKKQKIKHRLRFKNFLHAHALASNLGVEAISISPTLQRTVEKNHVLLLYDLFH